MTGPPPPHLNGKRVLAYAGDTAAAWDTTPEGDPLVFQEPLVALAIVKDDETSGVFTYWLYSNGTVADNLERIP